MPTGYGVSHAPNTHSSPNFLQETGGRDTLMAFAAILDPAQFTAVGTFPIKLTANAAQGAVTLTVAAIAGTVAAGSLLYFGAGKMARVTATANAGAVALTVEALPAALATNDTANYSPDPTANIYIPAGTFIGRTYAERDNNTPWGPWDAADDEFHLTYRDVHDARTNSMTELVRHGREVIENFLPNWATLSNPTKAKIRAAYQCYTRTSS